MITDTEDIEITVNLNLHPKDAKKVADELRELHELGIEPRKCLVNAVTLYRNLVKYMHSGGARYIDVPAWDGSKKVSTTRVVSAKALFSAIEDEIKKLEPS